MNYTHCFPKMSFGTYMIVQKIVNSLTNVSSFFFPEKNESIPPPPKKKNTHTQLNYNLRERVENSVAKRRNTCMEKGFNVQYSVI